MSPSCSELPLGGPQHKALVGRAEEMALLDAAFEADGTSGAVISGAAGVGKSRLAWEYLDQLIARGCVVVRVRGTASMATIPFGVFASFVGEGPAEGLGRLEALRRIAEGISESAGEAQLVLGIDDAHLLDEGSAAVVAHLAELGRAFIVVTLRTGEPAPDAVVSLWRDARAERLELQPLAKPDSAALVHCVLDGEVAPSTSERLWRWVRGNPLFLREVVRAGRARGSLDIEDGVWRWHGPLPADARLAEVVLQRLDEVTDSERTLLEVLAIGEPLDVEVLADLCGEDGLWGAERDDLIVIEEVGSRVLVRLVHPLYGELLAASIPPMRSRAIRVVLADAVEAGPAAAEELLRVASWRLDGDGRTIDPLIFVEASRRARVVGDYQLAERMARAAEGAGGGFAASLARAVALYWQGQFKETADLLSELECARDGWREAADVALALIVRSSALFWGLGRAADAQAVLSRGIAALNHDPARFDVLAHRASLLLFEGRADEAAEQATSVLAEPAASIDARLRALDAAIAAWGLQGKRSAAVGAAEMGLEPALARRDVLPEVAGEMMLGRCIADAFFGELASAEELASTVHEMISAEGAADYLGAWELFLGRVQLARGKAASAAGHLRAASATLREHDPGGFLPWCYGLLAQAETLRGHIGEAEEFLASATSCANAAIHVYDSEITLARAWLAAATGARSAAREKVRLAASQAASGGMAVAEAGAWHDLARLGDAREALSHLSDLAARVGGPLVMGYLEHARALASNDGPGFDRSVLLFEATGAALLAAEAAAEAADAYRSEGHTGSHLRATAKAQELLRDCEGTMTTPLRTVQSPAGVAALTEREREIVELAASGLSNREIADRLVVSVRTVNNHLNHAYAKLGTSERADLKIAVGLAGAAP